jgi:plastocyanin
MMAAGLGEYFPSATLEVYKSPADPEPAVRYKMTDVHVSSYHAAQVAGGAMSPEKFTLNFAKVEIEFKKPKTGSLKAGGSPMAALTPAGHPAPSGGSGPAQAAGVIAALPGTILAVKVQPATVDPGGTVTITVEGAGECKLAWLDLGDKSQAQPFESPFPKTFSHAFASPGTFTVVAWGFDPDSPKQRSEAKPGTCVGKRSATVQVRSRMMVAPAPKK